MNGDRRPDLATANDGFRSRFSQQGDSFGEA
jgi:hypothetical protein